MSHNYEGLISGLPNILTFLAPGVVIYIVFFLAIILVGDFFIEEKEVSY